MPSGSQGSVRYKKLDGIHVAIKTCAYNDPCLELEAQILQQIHSECPEMSMYFPKFIEFNNSELIVTRILNCEELHDLSRRLYKSNCRNVRKKASLIIKNICFIVICILETIRRKIGIVHNDLHSSNVLIQRTDVRNLIFNFEKTYKFKTYGYIPIIIDFGYAHVPNGIIASLQNSDIGYTIEEQDLLSDSRILLSSSLRSVDKLKVNKIFGSLNLDSKGWFDESTFINVYDEFYTLGCCENSSKSMDTVLTRLVNMMGNLLDESCIIECGDDCYLNSEESCQCSEKIFSYFSKLYEIRKEDYRNYNSLYSEAATIFKPLVVKCLSYNRDVKREKYENLTVKTNIDVIDEFINNDASVILA